MVKKTDKILKTQKKEGLPKIKVGDTIRFVQKIEGKSNQKTQPFEGVVLSKKHGNEIGAMITVRTKIGGIGIEKTIPIHSPSIKKIKIIKRGKTRKAKLYYLREAKGKKARLKREEVKGKSDWEEKKEQKKEGNETQKKKNKNKEEKDKKKNKKTAKKEKPVKED